ncbi:DsrE family protein [endosymbiont of unidentified scaly snail isolate Monju]|uniref:DsrE family protein n=1 Tax=endosymbiont of unidentified scaly snail isolate Monju TaxID=1248727 RepID=UPI0005BC1AD1|nr:DsrE family protein [endosymbiont of unidentified scaly snail isolate Monju]
MRGMLLALALLASGLVMAGDMRRIVFHVDENDPKKMNITLNNAANLNKYYQDKGEEAQIEIVTYGPGLMMLHAKKSPVKERIASFAQNFDNVSFKACANTMKKMKKKSGKDVPLLPQAEVVASGVMHLVKRQEEGWSYIRP